MIELLESIRYHSRKFPRRQLEQIIERKEEAIPLLLQIVEKLKNDPEKFINDRRRFDHIYAVYLLAQFRVKKLYPLLIDIVRSPGEKPFDIFGDTITGALNRILASTYDGNIDLLKSLIENEDANTYVRSAALRTMVALVLNDELQRDEVIDYFKELLTSALESKNYQMNTSIVVSSTRLYPEEVYDHIKRLYEEDKVENFVIRLIDVEETLQSSREAVLDESKQEGKFIDDAIKEMYWWASFDQPKLRKYNKLKSQKPSLSHTTNPAVKVEKVGRNEPCPCGSGRKYKKCCDSA